MTADAPDPTDAAPAEPNDAVPAEGPPTATDAPTVAPRMPGEIMRPAYLILGGAFVLIWLLIYVTITGSVRDDMHNAADEANKAPSTPKTNIEIPLPTNLFDSPPGDDTPPGDPSDSDPSDTDPADTDEPDTDPADADPADTDEPDTDPADTDEPDTDPSDDDSADTPPPDNG